MQKVNIYVLSETMIDVYRASTVACARLVPPGVLYEYSCRKALQGEASWSDGGPCHLEQDVRLVHHC